MELVKSILILILYLLNEAPLKTLLRNFFFWLFLQMFFFLYLKIRHRTAGRYNEHLQIAYKEQQIQTKVISLVITLQQILRGQLNKESKTQKMDQKNNVQLKNEEINDESSSSNYHREKKNKKMKITKNKGKGNRLRQRKRERTRIKSEEWEYEQIQKIFTLYGQYSSQWKNMQNEFEQRSANSIKNRFYTVIRTFLKLLFKYHPSIINKLPHEIPSKSILKFYQSRDQFEKFSDFGKKTMKKLNYNINSSQLKSVVLQHKQQIQQIYNLIFKIKEGQEFIPSRADLQVPIQKSQDDCFDNKKPKLEQDQSLNKEQRNIPAKQYNSKAINQQNAQARQTYAFSTQYTVPSPGYILFFPIVGLCQNSTQFNSFSYHF